MFKWFFKTDKPKVYLGIVAVVPRNDLKQYLDQWGLLGKEELDTPICNRLREYMGLPSAMSITTPTNNELILDMIVPNFQLGDFIVTSIEDVPTTLFWRPKIQICCRLYFLSSGKTKATFSVTEKWPWKYFFPRFFNLKAITRLRPFFNKEDMDYLVYRACEKLNTKIEKSI